MLRLGSLDMIVCFLFEYISITIISCSKVLSEIGVRLEATSKDLEGMLTWLEGEIDGISGHTSLMVDQHVAAVDNIATAADQ